MDRRTMIKRLEEEGFNVSTRFDYVRDCHIITITKDGVEVSCSYMGYDNPREFYDYITRRWDNERRSSGPARVSYGMMAAKSGIAYGSNTYMPYDPIQKVIFNPPATIVFWTDGSKTVVKAQNNDLFDYEKGLTMAIAKKAFGNKGNYFEQIKKWTKDQPGIIDCTTAEVIMHDCAEHAYQRLLNALHDKKATKADLGMAMEEAVGYLGQILDD